MIAFILKGVELRNPRLTRSPRIWLQYLCWCLQCWMRKHRPLYPVFIRQWAYRRYGHRPTRLIFAIWRANNPDWQPKPENYPYPRWLGDHAFGVFVPAWDKLTAWVRAGTGGRSHRCEFTARTNGALYGGNDGAFMEAYFERLLENIDGKTTD